MPKNVINQSQTTTSLERAKSENSIDENSPSAVIFVRAAERENALYLKII